MNLLIRFYNAEHAFGKLLEIFMDPNTKERNMSL